MLTEDKITEISCIAAESCKFFDAMIQYCHKYCMRSHGIKVNGKLTTRQQTKLSLGTKRASPMKMGI